MRPHDLGRSGVDRHGSCGVDPRDSPDRGLVGTPRCSITATGVLGSRSICSDWCRSRRRWAADRARRWSPQLAFIATFVLSALAAHFLATRSPGATTCRRGRGRVRVRAVRLPQAPHIQVLASFWTRSASRRCIRYDRTAPAGVGHPRRRRLGSAGAVVRVLLLSWVLVVLWLLWFAVGRWPVRQLAIAAAAFVAGALVSAAFHPRVPRHPPRHVRLQRSFGEIDSSARYASLLSASDELPSGAG